MAPPEWANLDGWEGIHQFWMPEIARELKANLPPGYRDRSPCSTTTASS